MNQRTASPAWLIALLFGCGQPETATDRPTSAGWTALPNAYAQHFEVQLRGADRRLVVFGHGGRSDTVGVYRLMGEAQWGELAVDTPLSRVAVVSTTHLAYLAALDARGIVVGIAHMDQVGDKGYKEQFHAGRIQEIARADGIDRERLVALDPQVLLDYPFGKGDRQANAFQATVGVTEYLEEHPLGRAEWIRFFGILVGKQHKADSLFEAIEHRYTFLRGLRTHLSTPPQVGFASHWKQTWSMPPGNSYISTLIEDAGGTYVLADTVANGNIEFTLEEFLALAAPLDHFGMLLATPGKVDVTTMAGGDPRVAALDPFRRGGFYGNSTTSDLFGQAMLEPDVILQDLRCIFHPALCRDHRPHYYYPVH